MKVLMIIYPNNTHLFCYECQLYCDTESQIVNASTNSREHYHWQQVISLTLALRLLCNSVLGWQPWSHPVLWTLEHCCSTTWNAMHRRSAELLVCMFCSPRCHINAIAADDNNYTSQSATMADSLGRSDSAGLHTKYAGQVDCYFHVLTCCGSS